MKLDYNKMAFAIGFAVVAALVAFGKLPAATLTFFAGHLLPSPVSSS